jgi:hypothetical protein
MVTSATCATLVAVLLAGPRAPAPQDAPRQGISDEAAAESHARMRAVLARIADKADTVNPYVGGAIVAARREQLASLPEGKQRLLRFQLLSELGFHELRMGANEEAVAHYEEARQLAAELGDKLPAGAAVQADHDAALAWLRLGETSNCVARHTSQSCILPIEEGGVHADQEGARRAIALLVGVLERDPSRAGARWLLNVAAMAVGEFPGGVPEGLRLPEGFFESGRAFPRLVDVAPELGLARFDMCGGVVVDDFDGDGVLDIVTSSWDLALAPAYFHGLGDGTFEQRDAGLEGIVGGLNMTHADFDGDGDLDILVLRGAWLGAAGKHPASLLRNDGRGRFVDVAFAAGVAGNGHYPGQAADWADYDNDGDLDLYLGHEMQPSVEAPGQLFRNRGDGTFEEVAAVAGVTNEHWAKAVAWGDVDGDRWPDLFVSNQNGPNRLYRNRGDGSFEEIAARAGVERPLASFPAWFWDHDNDGALDLFVGAYWPELAPIAATYFGASPAQARLELPALYRGDGRGGFRDVAREAGLAHPVMPMGANHGDLDGDGWLDLYLGTGYPGYEGLVPNVLYVSRGADADGRVAFDDVTTAAGVGHVQKGHGIAFADLDADGDVDLFAQMGGAFPGDAFGNVLFQNPGFGNRWVEVSLVGERSNRYGLGARLRFDVRTGEAVRTIWRWMDTGASFGSNPLRLHVGLGPAERLERLEVYWPTSDTTQVFTDVPLDTAVVVREGSDELRVGTRAGSRDGGGGR